MGLYTKIIDLQKLRQAWKQVYKNKPKEGVDQVTCEAFEADKENLLKALFIELQDHTYECQPVSLVPLYKGEKVRYISLYCMRDKVVQVSIANELRNLYENSLSNSCYAYRNGKSALQAGQDICSYTKAAGDKYVFRGDIHAFFDNILHEKLFAMLRERIREEDVLDLIQQELCVPSMERDGTLTEKRRGIYQGSSISPILSNIYLMDLDLTIEQETQFYIRYADDFLIFFDTIEEAEAYRDRLNLSYEEMGLELNQEKEKIVRVSEGFEFLGYHFDSEGMTVPDKAKEELQERLEEVWLDSSITSFDLRMKKALEIINGWEQYFSNVDDIGGILEYTIWVYRMQQAGQLDLNKMKEIRSGLENPFKDVMSYLVSIWKENQCKMQALQEYEYYYEMPEVWPDSVKWSPQLEELLSTYEKYAVREADDLKLELTQIYTDLKKYKNAAVFMEKAQWEQISETESKIHMTPEDEQSIAPVKLNQSQMDRFMELFVGREDLYAINELAENNRRICEDVLSPLFADVVKEHLKGETTVSTYVQRNNATVKYLVIDLDVSKAILLKQDKELLQEYTDKCMDLTRKFQTELKHLGINSYMENSGGRGFHLWIFFEEWISVKYVNLLTDVLETKMGSAWRDSGIQVEYFPNKTKVRNGKKGQAIKLPWGIHPKTGERSYFLTDSGDAYFPQTIVMDEVVCCSLQRVKRIISANQGQDSDANFKQKTEVDRDLTEFGELADSVKAVLENCNLMRFLCQKARKTQYLTHFERLSILYVFGHLGDEGKEFIHQVMSFTLNYSEAITQKFILRCPEKPISCVKLRDQYKQISAEIGCTCNFRRTKNCYPSPVLHALKKSEDNESVTMPLSRTVPANKQEILKNEINVGTRTQEIAEKLIELRKQRRSLDKAVRKSEQELARIFDENQTDSMEIKMGLLVRKKVNDNVEWSIEL